jgi:hypothetical protein
MEDRRMDSDSRQFCPNSIPTPPNPRLLRGIVFVVGDEVFEMVFQGFGVGFLDSLEDFDDDGGEAVGVEVDFLVVGDLAEVAGKNGVSGLTSGCVFGWSLLCWMMTQPVPSEVECESIVLTHLTSAKAAGKSAVMAPPKRSTCLKVAMLLVLWCSDDFSLVVCGVGCERWNRFFWGFLDQCRESRAC